MEVQLYITKYGDSTHNSFHEKNKIKYNWFFTGSPYLYLFPLYHFYLHFPQIQSQSSLVVFIFLPEFLFTRILACYAALILGPVAGWLTLLIFVSPLLFLFYFPIYKHNHPQSSSFCCCRLCCYYVRMPQQIHPPLPC